MNTPNRRLQDLSVWMKILLTAAANFIIALAMALMHHSNVGADPVTVLIGGIARFFSLSEGTAATALSATFFLFALCFNREQIKGATLLCVVTLGPFMNAGLAIIRPLVPQNLPFLVRVLETAAGACVLGLAIGFYLSLRFGASPTDSVMLWFHKVLRIDYQYCTWIFYTICLIAGVLLGGVFGVGTVLSLVLVGVCCNFMLRRLQGNTAQSADK